MMIRSLPLYVKPFFFEKLNRDPAVDRPLCRLPGVSPQNVRPCRFSRPFDILEQWVRISILRRKVASSPPATRAGYDDAAGTVLQHRHFRRCPGASPKLVRTDIPSPETARAADKTHGWTAAAFFGKAISAARREPILWLIPGLSPDFGDSADQHFVSLPAR
jgi:hypothetical protein